jgi:anti-sigma B factor antagonist
MRRSPNSSAPATPRGDGTCVDVAVSGDFDMLATFKLEPEVDRLLAETRVGRLILDLAETQFIDSAGVGALLSIRERTEQLGVELILANVPDPVQRVLDLTGNRRRVGTVTARPEAAATATPARSPGACAMRTRLNGT